MPQEQAGDEMGTDIDFVGFAEDCRVEGRVDLEDSRLADLLNRRKTITVHDVTLVSTIDGHTQEFEKLEISRDELDIVVASGPRGDPKRRLATRPNGVTVKLGPYCAEGFMHAPPTANPVRAFAGKPTMVAITDAVLEYDFCNEPVSQWFRTLLVNRELAISLRAATSSGGMQPGAA
ncbi:MAG: hypothetical protein ABSD62_06795 [Candidatus Limnocylindrales bacterium]|jgi:hypothetical protein